MGRTPRTRLTSEQVMALWIEQAHAMPQLPLVWELGIRQVPFWRHITWHPKSPVFRPHELYVLTRSQGDAWVVTSHLRNMVEPYSPDDMLFHIVRGMVHDDFIGKYPPERPHLLGRPTELVCDDPLLMDMLTPTMADLGIRCRVQPCSDDLLTVRNIFDNIVAESAPVPGLADLPYVTTDLQASYYHAAAAFFSLQPWGYLTDEEVCALRVPSSDAPRYAVVRGSRYHQYYGLHVFDLRDDAHAYVEQGYAIDANASSVLLEYDVPQAMSFSDLDAIARHGWSIAAPHAYPVLRRLPENTNNTHLPSLHDLIWMTGALQGLISYLNERIAARPMWVVPVDQTYRVTIGERSFDASLRLPVSDSGSAPHIVAAIHTDPETSPTPRAMSS
jgi:hypothetical protein